MFVNVRIKLNKNMIWNFTENTDHKFQDGIFLHGCPPNYGNRFDKYILSTHYV